MRVNLDQIEFYHGPSLQRPSINSQKVPPDHATADVPQNFQHSFPAQTVFCPRPCEASLRDTLPLADTTHEWNIFDVEINDLYGSNRPEMTKDVEPAVTKNMPTTSDILSGSGSSAPAFSEPVPLTDSVAPVPRHAGTDLLDRAPYMRENDLPGKLVQHFIIKVNHYSLII